MKLRVLWHRAESFKGLDRDRHDDIPKRVAEQLALADAHDGLQQREQGPNGPRVIPARTTDAEEWSRWKTCSVTIAALGKDHDALANPIAHCSAISL